MHRTDKEEPLLPVEFQADQREVRSALKVLLVETSIPRATLLSGYQEQAKNRLKLRKREDAVVAKKSESKS